jgi:hypothetical protein
MANFFKTRIAQTFGILDSGKYKSQRFEAANWGSYNTSMQSDFESDGSQAVEGSRQRRWWLGGGRRMAQLLPPIQGDASSDILIPTWIGLGLGDDICPANERVGRALPLGRRVALN